MHLPFAMARDMVAASLLNRVFSPTITVFREAPLIVMSLPETEATVPVTPPLVRSLCEHFPSTAGLIHTHPATTMPPLVGVPGSGRTLTQLPVVTSDRAAGPN